MDTQRALITDYGKYVGRFDAIADYLARRQPPALMVWGRHDPFSDRLIRASCAASSAKFSWLSSARHLMKANMNAFHYPIEDEVVNGLTNLGMLPHRGEPHLGVLWSVTIVWGCAEAALAAS